MLETPPNWIIVSAQIAIFVVFWVLMKRWVFDPALRIIQERTARSEGAVREARAIQAEAEQLKREHSATLDAARDEAHREVQELLRSAEVEQKRLVNVAREEAQRELAEARARIAQEVGVARQALRDQSEEIAREVARKVLGRAV